MNDIINKFLLVGDRFMSEMHLRDPIVGNYSACAPFIKHKQRIRKFIEAGDIRYIYKNDLDKTCFQHVMAYGDFKDLKRRTQTDNVLKDEAFKIASDPKHDGYQRRLASMVYTFSDKKSKEVGISMELHSNKQLADELHKPIIRKLEKRKVYSSYRDNI